MDQELVQYLDERSAAVDLRFEEIRREFAEMRGNFEGVRGDFEPMRGEVHEGFEEVKGHNGILIKDLRYKVH